MDKNLEVYNSKGVVNWYSHLHEIQPVEKSVFEKHQALLVNGNVLDIGIGGGRTTAFLFPKCKTYTGIDYSEGFIAAVKRNHPGVSCSVMDARDLSAFKDKSFDVVNFSFNGIDYVDAAGRKKILSEIARVLKPSGLFFFSTHNRDHPGFNVNPWLDNTQSAFTNLKTFIKLIPFFPKKIWNKKNEQFNEGYAIINDSAHAYSLMTFYTSPAYLREQLHEAGFKHVDFLTRAGEKKEDKSLEDWIFVTCERASA